MKRSASLQSGSLLPRTLVASCLLLALGSLIPASARRADIWSLPSYVEYGKASWYGEGFHGRPTANGETFHMLEPTAAHRKAPLGIHAIVTNLSNGHAVRVRINDRGPYIDGRILDLSYHAARILDMVEPGVVRVKIEFLPETYRTPPAYTVQAGVYNDLYSAASMQKRLSAQFPRVWTALGYRRQQLYRVRLGLFERRDDAELAARQITLQGYPATIVSLH